MQIRSAALRITMITLALVVAMFVNSGTTKNVSAQQTAVASATPSPNATMQSMVLTHGEGPNDGDEFMVKNADGTPIKRKFEVKPDFGWQNISILDVKANGGTFFRPDQVADLRFMTAQDKALYTAQVLAVHGHGNAAEFALPPCDGTMPWDINMLLATNHIWNTSQLDYVELFAYLKNNDGSKTKVRLAKFTWLGSTGLRIDYMHPYAQLYLGDRGASRWIYPGNVLPLELVPNATSSNSGWMYWPGLMGISLNMRDMHSPFMNCIGIGGRIVNTVGENDTWFGILDMVEMRKGNERRGDGLFYGYKNGLYPTGEICGETAACTPPPVCDTTIEWIHPSQLPRCGDCDFPVSIDLLNKVGSRSEIAKAKLAWWRDGNIMKQLNSFYVAASYSRKHAPANCNDLVWIPIRRGSLDCYGIKNLPFGIKTIGDLIDATGQAVTYGASEARVNELLKTWIELTQK